MTNEALTMNAKEMLGIILACVLNLCMVVLAVYDGQSFSWIFPVLAATFGAIVGSSGVPKCEYRNTSWKRAWRYGREGLTIGIITGIISTVLILAYASLVIRKPLWGQTDHCMQCISGYST